MSTPCTLFGGCQCPSCQSPSPATPLTVVNRPGLGTLRYRVGTFSTFRQSMLDAITLNPVSNSNPNNSSQIFTLTSRSSDDYGVAMLELWAYVCDVLTFYQQAIANEAYLRTATQPTSLARLASLLGYRPAPAVAASVLLAFLANKGASAVVPAGTQTQAVPPPGQQPAVFEVSAQTAVNAVNNQPVLLGPKQTLSLSTSGVLIQDDPANPVAKGSRLVFIDTSSAFLSEQQVTAVVPQPSGKLVSWVGDLQGQDPMEVEVFREGRTFRYFGANAPASYLSAAPSTDGKSLSWSQVTMVTDGSNPNDAGHSFHLAAVPPGDTIWLDGTFTGLAAGGQVAIQLVDTDGFRRVIRDSIASVVSGSSSRGLLSGASTGIRLSSATTPAVNDLRTIVIHELLGPDLIFAATGFQDFTTAYYPAGTKTIYLLDASHLDEGSQLLLVSWDGNGIYGDLVTQTSEWTALVQNYTFLGYEVTFTPELKHDYGVSFTSVYANLATATQGKTQKAEVLGSGDASQAWQEFALKGKPVTYVSDPAAERGAASTLRVFVNGAEWTEVDSFYSHGPGDQIFVTRVGDDGTWYVRFGNSDTGQRVPTGNRNILAMYRVGASSNGNVAAGAISLIVQPVQGVQSVINPLPAYGGADGEALDRVRSNAPGSVLTLGRAISLRDYESLTLTFAGIAKAKAAWADFNDRRGVTLTVSATGGQPLDQLVQPLRSFLDDHRDPNVPLSIGEALLVPFVFRARIHVKQGALQSTVKSAAEAAIGATGDQGYLSFARIDIGETIFQSKLLAVLQEVPGVEWVELVEFSSDNSYDNFGFSPDSPTYQHHAYHLVKKEHFSLQPQMLEAVYISPQQIAWPSLTDSDDDFSMDLSYVGGVNDLH